MAIEQALRVLGWQELPDDEQPPEWMWLLDADLVEWFDEVRQKRKEKYGLTDADDDEDVSGTGMVSNEYAKGRRRR